jgi:repressor LexA
MGQLSERQRKILSFIVDFTAKHDYPPTIREIGEKVGISSTSVVNYNLAKLEEMELLTREREVSRGLSLNRARLVEMGILNGANEAMGATGRQHGRNGSGRFRVPVLGKIAAGNPLPVNPFEPGNTDDWIELAESLLGSPDKLFALRVQGQSMIDASVLDGDIVILRHQDTAEDGDMVAAWIEGDEETTLKYLRRDGPNVILVPANPNPEYQPIVRPAEKVRINGKVVSVIRVMH